MGGQEERYVHLTQGHRDVPCRTLRVGAPGPSVDFAIAVISVEETTEEITASHPPGRRPMDQEDRLLWQL